jgi:hypothetical protein
MPQLDRTSSRRSPWSTVVMLATWLLVAAWPAGAGAIQATPPAASVATSQSAVDLGDSFVYQITVEGATDAKPPTLPPSDAWDAEYMGGRDESMRSTFIVNGRVTESSSLKYVMQWRITPRRLGPSAIDSFTFDVAGTAVRVPRVQFRVNEPQESPNFRLVLECDRVEAYVGEPVRMRLVWSVGANVKDAAFTGPDGDDLFDIQTLDPRPARARGGQLNPNEPWRSVPFLGNETVVTRSQGQLDGRSVPVFTLDLVVTPRQAGELVIGPYRVACDEVLGQRARGFFNSPFGDLSQTRRTVVTGNSLKLAVRQLPTEGKPDGFNGLIGRYSIEASAAASEANVGDPVPLTIVIRGPEPMPGLTPPDLSLQSDFAAAFRPAPEGWEDAPGAADGERRFTTTVRPRSDAITQIPPIVLPFFDTATGAYASAATEPIPLKVRPSRQVTVADATRSGGSASSMSATPAAPARLSSMPPGVGANTESLDAIVNRQVSIMTMATSAPGIVLLGAPPLAWSIAWLATAFARKADPARAARRMAAHRATSAIESATTVEQLTAAMRVALAPFLSMAADAITSADAHKGPFTPTVRRDIANLLERLEAGEFGPTDTVRLDHLRSQAKGLLTTLREVA